MSARRRNLVQQYSEQAKGCARTPPSIYGNKMTTHYDIYRKVSGQWVLIRSKLLEYQGELEAVVQAAPEFEYKVEEVTTTTVAVRNATKGQ